ncbi:hypothetical protein F511_04463 [Dorcoceras hygrometricum]|uniref:AB hydrolase-1 domain-containing protein n=1 Tax=Dorcoceras hygrometricum TaxID=472368 RepID=A0A2Z7CAN5_9LAMI|nr:hypothetical protein F511_04463 [Dorcoceras hygrometricum]
MIEASVIRQFRLGSFHIVAHSMGCVIALALAAKNSKSVKSISLIAPPYYSSSKGDASLVALESLAMRREWPPLLFGSALMSWYEHLGRWVCFFICRNHNTWEWILKLLVGTRGIHFTVTDMTRHTHHSAWHTMHNVVCGGAKHLDGYLEVLTAARVKIRVVQGTRDRVVPMECSLNMKIKAPHVELEIVPNADHISLLKLCASVPKEYYVEYEDGTSSRGFTANETFYFRSDSGETTIIKNVKFGCGLDNKVLYGKYRNNKISGVMGLGWKSYSFLRQIMPQSHGKFSHCFPPLSKNMSKTYLRFGSSVIKPPQNAKTTLLYNLRFSQSYYIDVQGISVGKTRLKISQRVFQEMHRGQVVPSTIDAGIMYSKVVYPAFNVLQTHLENYFSGFSNLRKIEDGLGFELCYERTKPEGYNNLPDVTFHMRRFFTAER